MSDFQRCRLSHALRALPLATLLLAPIAAQAGDDPSIQEPLRGQIQSAMKTLIEHNTIGGVYRHFDPVAGELLELELEELHSGIVRKGDFYVSCADFRSADGRSFDFDFFVLPSDNSVRAVQAVVHKTDGNKRPYDLEP